MAHLYLKKSALFFAMNMSLVACSNNVMLYSDNTPKLEPTAFFSGSLSAHGVVKDFKGKVIRYFNADIAASWEDGVGTLDESFVFDDGEHQKRIWTLTPIKSSEPGVQMFEGTAGDVVGKAIVKVAGNAMMLKYVLRVQRDNGEIDVTVDDKMYLVSDGVIINESKMSKWGLPVGEVVLTITKN